VNRWVSALLLILLIQTGIVAVVFWPDKASQEHTTTRLLAPFPITAIDELHIGDEFDNEAVLVRSGEKWLLPDRENLPANAKTIDKLLHDLTNQSGNWPVARSSAARQRFQVADYFYQKKLKLFSGGEELGTVFLGTSPGFRKVHARNADQNAIYSISLNGFEVPASSEAWLDPKLLQVRVPLRIDTDLYNLYIEDGRWKSATGVRPDKAELENLLSALKELQVNGIADEDLQRELAEVEDDLVLTIQSLAGEVTLEVITRNGEHFIHSSEFPLFFNLSAFDFDRLTGVDARLISGEDSRQ
jgi:Domain of unknown function (DUF4340)